MNGSSAGLVVIGGPTAVGKTAFAVELAKILGADIVSADSMQVYRHLAIGTGKPTPGELDGVRCHLIDHVEPEEQYNLGRFVAEADAVIGPALAAGRPAVVCGGTGLYIKGLLEGVFPDLPRAPEIRAALHAEADSGRDALARLHAELSAADPPAAARITPADRQRIVRALEVARATGRPISSFQTQSAEAPRYPSRYLVLDRPRDELRARIDARVDAMAAAGLLDELRDYLAAGHPRECPAIRALGYTDLLEHLDGRIDLGGALERMKVRTRRYAKRQLTWFRGVAGARWLDASSENPSRMAARVAAELS